MLCRESLSVVKEAELGFSRPHTTDFPKQMVVKSKGNPLGWWNIIIWPDEMENGYLGGGFKYFLFSSQNLGKIPILTNIFQRGWNHQLATIFEK